MKMPKKHAQLAGTMEKRAYLCEVRAEQDEQRGTFITGHPIVFNQITEIKTWVGTIRETIDPEAIDEKTDMRDVRFLVGHDDRMIPLARSRNNNANSTMQLTPDETGLGMRANVDAENNTTARALYSAAGRGDISGMSFAFFVDKDSWDDLDTDTPTRHIRHISRIIEVSAVAFPAYEGTDLEAADERDRLESLVSSLESARKQLKEQRAQEENAQRREAAINALRR